MFKTKIFILATLLGIVSLNSSCALMRAISRGETRKAEHASLVLNQEGCRAMNQIGIVIKPSDDVNACRLEDVNFSSRGAYENDDYFNVSNLRDTKNIYVTVGIRKTYVTWIELKPKDSKLGEKVILSPSDFSK
jgi:hypothetical protein